MISKKDADKARQESAERVQAAYDEYESRIDKHITDCTNEKEFKLRTNNRYEVEALNNLLNDYRGEHWKVSVRHEDSPKAGTAVERTGWFFITLT